MDFRNCLHVALAAAAICYVAGPSVAQSASVTYFKKDLATIPGHKIALEQTTETNIDCSLMPLPAIELISPPSHGHISTSREKFFPYFSAPNPRVKCNGRKIDGLILYYVPNARYTGRDFTKYRIAFSNGSVREITVNIDVN